jgi:predicted transposase/invertase (TIGR01784 family)
MSNQVVWNKRPTEASFFDSWLKWNLFERKGIEVPQDFSLLEKREMLADVIDREYAEREARGRAEGEAKGEAKGRAEGWKTAQIAIAKKLKARGFSLADIADDTELPVALIAQL